MSKNAKRPTNDGSDDRPNGNDARSDDNPKLQGGAAGNELKDTEDWVTGDEPATAAQLSYLHTLAEEAGEEVPEGLRKAAASEHIDRLQEATGRGSQD